MLNAIQRCWNFDAIAAVEFLAAIARLNTRTLVRTKPLEMHVEGPRR